MEEFQESWGASVCVDDVLVALLCCALLAATAAVDAAAASCVPPAVPGDVKGCGVPGYASQAAVVDGSQLVTAVGFDAASSAPGSSCEDLCRCGNVPASCEACVAPSVPGDVSCSQLVTAIHLNAASSAPGSPREDLCRCGNVPASCEACVTPEVSGAVIDASAAPAGSGATPAGPGVVRGDDVVLGGSSLIASTCQDEGAATTFVQALWGVQPVHKIWDINWAGWGLPDCDASVKRVTDPACVTSAVDMAGWWRGLLPHQQQFVDQMRSRWPLSAHVWQPVLGSDPDWPFLSAVLTEGVSIVHPQNVPMVSVARNYASFNECAAACGAVFASELERGLITAAPEWFASQWVHPLGAVPKKNGGVRIIHDCSYPRGASLNDAQSYLYLPWASIDSILQEVTPLCWMAGIDIQEYYRNFPVNPVCWPLQCYRDAEGQLIVDSRLQFGHRMAPEVAGRFSAALQRRLMSEFDASVTAVMDDFTIISPAQDTCLAAWRGSCSRLESLGFKLSQGPGKTEPPAHVKVSLGLEIDSVSMTVGLCPVKLAKLRDVCQQCLVSKFVTRKQLEKLLGFLMWVSRVVYAGRTFCHNLQVTMHRLRKPSHRVRVSAWLRSELLWWLNVAPSLNGKHQILPAMPVKWAQFQTDASLTGAGGEPCVGIWLQGAYNSLSYTQLCSCFADVPEKTAHISVWEMYAVVVCVRFYGDYMAGRYWRVRTDNSQVVAWFMKGDAPPHLVSLWLKEMATLSVQLRFRIGAKHIPGAANCMADALSRCAWSVVHTLLQRWAVSQSEEWLLVPDAAAPPLTYRGRVLPARSGGDTAEAGAASGGAGLFEA